MSASGSPSQTPALVRIVDRLGDTFERLESRVRDRAYQIFRDRREDEGDPISDWLEARMQVVIPLELAVKEEKKKLVVEADLKGFSPEEIEIEISDGELKLCGSHQCSSTGKKGGASHSVTETTQFYQSVALPCAVDVGGSEAKLLKNGKLKILLPKQAADK